MQKSGNCGVERTRAYRIRKGGRIFAGIAGTLMLIAFTCGAVLPLIPDAQGQRDWKLFYIAGPSSLVLALFIALAMYNTIWSKLIIDGQKIYTTGSIPARSLYFDQIHGFTTLPDSSIHIIPYSREHKKISISIYTERRPELLAWLRGRFPDLDEAHAREQNAGALGDAGLGETEEYRLRRLAGQRQATRALNWTGGLSALWLLLLPVPYPLAVAVCIAIPPLVIAASKYFHGRITLRTINERTSFPDATIALGAPAAALALRALTDYHLLAFNELCVPVLLFTAILVVISIRGAKPATINARRRGMIVSTLTLIYLGYSLGVLIIANCYLDRSTPQLYAAAVLRKHISWQRTEGHEGRSHLLLLSPWGPRADTQEVQVSVPVFNYARPGRAILIRLRGGLLHMQWFALQQEPAFGLDTMLWQRR